jgi:hypothetical protein
MPVKKAIKPGEKVLQLSKSFFHYLTYILYIGHIQYCVFIKLLNKNRIPLFYTVFTNEPDFRKLCMEIGDAWDQNIFAKILCESKVVQGQFDIVRFLQENCLFSLHLLLKSRKKYK